MKRFSFSIGLVMLGSSLSFWCGVGDFLAHGDSFGHPADYFRRLSRSCVIRPPLSRSKPGASGESEQFETALKGVGVNSRFRRRTADLRVLPS